MLLTVCITPAIAADTPWLAGAYSFSDELGGFRITAVAGKGTRENPVVVIEDLFSATPVTLVIRTVRPINSFDNSGEYANGMLFLRVVARNGGGQGWVEFEFELQEILGTPSSFNDGLSFEQRRADQTAITSSRFGEFSHDFEPADKLLFRDGHVDPKATAEFSFLITDYTPKWQFYLIQDPRIPSS